MVGFPTLGEAARTLVCPQSHSVRTVIVQNMYAECPEGKDSLPSLTSMLSFVAISASQEGL